MSFRYKTIIGVAVIQVVMLTLLVWSAIGILTLSNERELIKRSYTTTELFAAANKDAVLSSDLATLESFVISVLKRPGIIYARVLGTLGGYTRKITEFIHAQAAVIEKLNANETPDELSALRMFSPAAESGVYESSD